MSKEKVLNSSCVGKESASAARCILALGIIRLVLVQAIFRNVFVAYHESLVQIAAKVFEKNFAAITFSCNKELKDHNSESKEQFAEL